MEINEANIIRLIQDGSTLIEQATRLIRDPESRFSRVIASPSFIAAIFVLKENMETFYPSISKDVFDSKIIYLIAAISLACAENRELDLNKLLGDMDLTLE